MSRRQDARITELCGDQDGVVARSQLLAAGLTPAEIRQRLRAGHWVALFAGVYSTTTGPLSERARIWAGLLAAGSPAAVSHRSQLWLAGVIDAAPDVVQVSVPEDRRVNSVPGVRVVRRRDFASVVRSAASPPQVRLETAVLDAADQTRVPETALGLVLAATQRRLTTPARLRAELALRSRHRWRRLLSEVLAEAELGVQSMLERRYHLDVERPHALPRATRNRTEKRTGEAALYRDVRYPWQMIVELDGRRTHPPERAFRDWRRDNASALRLEATLRYGWHDVAGRPCQVAAQVAELLILNGWPGRMKSCSRCG